MATTTQQPGQSWRDAAIERSVAITDAWEVTKAYAGRIAEWVLFVCMIINIVEILPGVVFWTWFSNTIMGVQVVMLDVGGFSLASMATHARENGDEAAARRASNTAYFLIGLMIVTLVLVSLGLLWPALKQYTDMAEKGLILVRVVMVVIYGHVIHGLRRTSEAALTPVQVASLEARLQEQVAQLQQQSAQLVATANEQNSQQAAQLEMRIQELAALFPPSATVSDIDLVQMMETLHQQLSVQLDTKLQEITDELAQKYSQNIPQNVEQTEEILAEQIGQKWEEEIGQNTEEISVVLEPKTGQKSGTNRGKFGGTKSATKRGTTSRAKPARQAALDLLKKHPELDAELLAKRLKVTPKYARMLLAEIRPQRASAEGENVVE